MVMFTASSMLKILCFQHQEDHDRPWKEAAAKRHSGLDWRWQQKLWQRRRRLQRRKSPKAHFAPSSYIYIQHILYIYTVDDYHYYIYDARVPPPSPFLSLFFSQHLSTQLLVWQEEVFLQFTRGFFASPILAFTFFSRVGVSPRKGYLL